MYAVFVLGLNAIRLLKSICVEVASIPGRRERWPGKHCLRMRQNYQESW